MVSPPKRLTTAELRAMISGGATRDELPTKANGRSVTSTRESAQSAYRKQLDKIERTKQFKERQKTLTAEKYFTAEKNTRARELVRQREALISAGVKGTSLDLRTDRAVNVDTTKNVNVDTTKNVKPTFVKPDFSDTTKYKVHGQTVNYQGQAEFNPQVKSKSSNPKNNEYDYTPIESVNYDSDINNPASVTNEQFMTNEELVHHGKTIGIGTGVAVASGIIIYLMTKGKLL